MRLHFIQLTSALVILLGLNLVAVGQTQLILLNREKVVARFEYGDDISYKLKKSTSFTKASMLGATEFSLITFNDTIPFSSIERVSLKGHHGGTPLLAKFFITAGIAYFTLDQFNNVVVHGQKPDMEPSVWKPSLVLVAAGFAIKYIRKGSLRIRHPAKIVAAERGSRFFKSDE